MQRALILILFFPLFSFGQDADYRMQFSLGLHSIINWGEREFDNLTQREDAYSLYLKEKYDIRYKKNNYSPGVAVGFGFDWFHKEHFVLRQELSAFVNSYSEEITFEIVDIGNGDTTWRDDYTTNEVGLGYSGKVASIGKTYGTRIGVLGMYSKQNLKLGAGLNWSRRFTEDIFSYARAYNPWTFGRQTMGYLTHQLAAAFHAEYSFGRFSAVFDFSQTVATLKKDKGANYFEDGVDKYPFSTNMDFRFPSMITVELQFNFKKIS